MDSPALEARTHRDGIRLSLRARLAIFTAISVAVLGTAGALVWPQALGGGADYRLRMDMAGFKPAELAVPPSRAVTVQIVNADSPFHPGGALHGFTVPELGIDVRIEPRSAVTVALPPLAPGEYEFYCDTCCGGKASPTMNGKIVVTS